MSEARVQRFIEALGRLESDGDVEPLVGMFADEAELDTATATADLRGRDGARRLWSEDRALFSDVRSDFRTVVVDGDQAALEWHREGTSPAGEAVSYDGVSLLRFEGDGIRRFSTYFDPTALTPAASA